MIWPIRNVIRAISLCIFALPTAILAHATLFLGHEHRIGGSEHVSLATMFVGSILSGAFLLAWSFRNRIDIIPRAFPLATTALFFFGVIEALEPSHIIPVVAPFILYAIAYAIRTVLAGTLKVASGRAISGIRHRTTVVVRIHTLIEYLIRPKHCIYALHGPRAPPSFVNTYRA